VEALPRGTVTFLFTDVEGSTRLLTELGASAYAAALARHRGLLRAVFAAHDGVEVDTQGDAIFVAFGTAGDALAAAAAGQSALAGGPVRVRMGVHTGEPLLTDEGYVGLDVHRAARIAAAGHGGQVLVSESTRTLAPSADLVDLGPHRLKDLSAPERLYQVGAATFPPLETLYRTNLPVPATTFVGRERDLAGLSALLGRDEVRLVTVTGPGGVGKTRVALQAAAEAAERYPDGITWVPLAPLRDPAHVLPELATALDVRRTGDVHEQVAAALGGRRVLLLLDNAEQVVDAAADLARVVAATSADVLVTSREPLLVAAEHEYPLAELDRADAVALFVSRALASRPDFRPSAAVSDLCDRLDRLPLALELAAARTRAVSAEALLERLDGRLDLLRGGRDSDPRQRTLRATIEWSHDLLGERERALFARLAVFAGGCRLGDAVDVCDADLDTLAALVEKSLVRRRGDPDGADRYWLLETIGEFAAERLAELPEAQELRRRHARRFVGETEAAFARILAGGPARHEYERLSADEGNLRAALETLRDDGEPEELGRLCTALFFHWYFRGDTQEGRAWTRAALEGDVGEALRSELENELAGFLYVSGERAEARALTETSVARSRRIGDDRTLLYGLTTLGNVLLDEPGGPELARGPYEEALALAVAQQAGWWQHALTSNLGLLDVVAGHLDRAHARFVSARDRATAAGDELGAAEATVNLAVAEVELGRPAEARTTLATGLAAAPELGLRPWVLNGLRVAALLEASDGDPERGARLFGAVETLERELALAQDEIDRRYVARTEAGLRAALGDGGVARLAAAGAALSLEEAVALALAALDTAAPPP
jgi:predicted ATPase